MFFNVGNSRPSSTKGYVGSKGTVNYIYKSKGWLAVNYLDDFGSAETWDKAQEVFLDLKETIASCGLEESVNTAWEPSTKMPFLGIWLDTEKCGMFGWKIEFYSKMCKTWMVCSYPVCWNF